MGNLREVRPGVVQEDVGPLVIRRFTLTRTNGETIPVRVLCRKEVAILIPDRVLAVESAPPETPDGG